jgi:hypothetical protein
MYLQMELKIVGQALQWHAADHPLSCQPAEQKTECDLGNEHLARHYQVDDQKPT